MKIRFLLVLAGLVTNNVLAQVNVMSVAPSEKDNSVEAELASFKLADGYKVELFASEELGIANPCAMRWDEKGRLWVLTIPTYPQPFPGTKPNDRLVILEDTDKDGVADRSSVFADSLNIPLGFELGYGGVFLGQQTELLFLKDTDGDGKADKREVLLSGFGTHDSHQTINSFVWSPGGELFFSQGHSIYSRVETAWGIKKADRAAIWRYRPMQNRLDVFVDGSTASVNPWGMNFGEWGEMFHKANDPELFYTVPALVNSTHRLLLPPIGKLIIKGSIIEIIRTKHMPDDLWGDFIVAGYYNNKIERMRVVEDSSGYRSTLLEPLMTSSSRSFRPVDIKIGPDGALYVLDWYDPIIGHYQASMRHPERDKTRGRIWRITATSKPLVTPPVLTGQTIPALLDHLKSKEHWTRYQVRRILAEKNFEDIRKPVSEWISALNPSDPWYEHHLLEALHVYESHEEIAPGLLKKLVSAREPGARAYAARLIGRWSDRLEKPLEWIRPLAVDSVSRVRLDALAALSYIRLPESVAVAAAMYRLPTDKFIDHAFEKTVYGLQDLWEPALKDGRLKFDQPADLARVVTMQPPSWYSGSDFLKLTEGNLPPAIRRKLLLLATEKGNQIDMESVFSYQNLTEDAVLADQLSRLPPHSLSAPALEQLKRVLETNKNPSATRSAIRLISSWKLKSLSGVVRTVALNQNQETGLRAAAIVALGDLSGKEVIPVLEKWIHDTRTARPLRLAAIQSIAAVDMDLAAAGALTELARTGNSIQEAQEVLGPVLSRKGGTEAFVKALSTKPISKEKAGQMLEVLAVAGMDAPALRSVLNKKSGVKSGITRSYDRAYVDQLTKRIETSGNAENGKKIYEANVTCTSCHAINGAGGKVGPDLSAIGRGLSVREIISEVLWPNHNVKEGYNRIELETTNGDLIQGIKAFENAEEIHVGTAESKAIKVISKQSITKQTESGSLMPAGLVDHYSEEELRDLLKYLSKLGV